MALCKCDFCAAEKTVAAAHGRTQPGGKPGAMHKIQLQSEGQVHIKLQAQGWSLIKGRLRCVKCEEKRKAENQKPKWLENAVETQIEKEIAMEKTANVTELRKATPAQRREIHQHLLSFYDTKAGRYQDTATDKTIADMICGGCMPGWVAEIREADYGPDGGNAELEAVRAEVEAMRRDFDGKIAAMVKRIDAIKAAVGPKAVRA
jgi:hypothetical protein